MNFKMTSAKRPTWKSVEKPTVTICHAGWQRFTATYDGSPSRPISARTFPEALRAVTARMAQERGQ